MALEGYMQVKSVGPSGSLDQTSFGRTKTSGRCLRRTSEILKVTTLRLRRMYVWPSLVERIAYFSDWLHAKKAVALCLRYVRILQAWGYWIIGASDLQVRYVPEVARHCTRAAYGRITRGCVDPAPPFTNCAVDFFGLFIIKQGHKELKHYGALFMCMGSRAVHIDNKYCRQTPS